MVEHDFLCHYGIKGMKWGIRRYQNPDGTLTAAGKARYGGEKAEKYRAKLLKKANKMNKYGEYGRAISNIKAMSNDELAKELIKRDSKAKKAGAFGAGFTTGAHALAKRFGIVEADKEMAEIVSDTTGLSPELSYILTQVSGFTTDAIGGYFTGKNAYKKQYAVDLINDYNKKPISKLESDNPEYQLKISKEDVNRGLTRKQRKALKKEYNNVFKEEEDKIKAKYDKQKETLLSEITELANKYSFDPDDGGNAKTKEDARAAEKYLSLWDKYYELEDAQRDEAYNSTVSKFEEKYGKRGARIASGNARL